MSANSGDKARYGRLRKQKLLRRERARLLRKQLLEAAGKPPVAVTL
ncbi:MAG: hypothetical protein M3Y27_28295 [Acidobacteriota bacterium]|nr:hypothetical protein [Acidobacteriota bacterium]